MRRLESPTKNFAVVIALLLATSLFATSANAAQIFKDQLKPWQVLRTTHIEVLYPTGLEQTASRASQYAEEAILYWEDALNQDFTEIIYLRISDENDRTTYSSEVLPHSVIHIDHPFGGEQVLQRPGSESLLEYLIFQEVGRILDETYLEAFPKDLRAIFGKVILPSILKPHVYREGLLSLNRVDIAYVNMLARGAISGSALPTISQLSAPHVRWFWPDSEQYALSIGALFLDDLAEQNPAILDEIQTINASFPIPSMVVGALALSTDMPLEDHYLEFLQRARAEFTSDIRARSAVTQEIDLLKLSPSDLQAHQPSWSPDGTFVIYVAEDVNRSQGLRWVQWDGFEDRPVLACSCHSPEWLDFSHIVYLKQTENLRGQSSNDLFIYNRLEHTESQLTLGERIYALFPVQIDEQSIGLLRHRPDGQSDLVFFNIDNRSRHIVAEFGVGEEPIDFAINRNTQELVLSIWDEARGIHLRMYDKDGVQTRVIEIEDAKMLYPKFSFDGKFLLFSSNMEGAYEVHALRLEDNAHFQVTNSIAGSIEATPSPDGEYLALIQYSVTGFGLERLPFEPERWQRIDPTPIEITDIDADGLSGDSASNTVRSADSDRDLDSSSYQPQESLFPTFFVPLVGPWNAGLYTQNVDPLGFMSYQAAVGISLAPFELFYDLSYTHRTVMPFLRVRLNGSPTYHRQEVALELPVSQVENHPRYVEAGIIKSPEQTELFILGLINDQSGFDLLERASSMRTRVGTAWTIAGRSNRLEFDWTEAFKLPLLSIRGPQWLSMSASAAWSNLAEYRLGGGMKGDRPLRGHPDVLRGSQRISLHLDYEFPLLMIETACCRHYPLPLFFNELRANLYLDSGIIGSSLDLQNLRVGFGSEVKLRLIFGYGLFSSWMRMGFAYGLGSDRPQLYLNFDQDF